MIVVFRCHHRLLLWIVVQMYCRYFVGWCTKSLQNSVLYCVYLFYPFLILLPLTIIHSIVDVAVSASICPVGPSPSLLFGVVVLWSFPFIAPWTIGKSLVLWFHWCAWYLVCLPLTDIGGVRPLPVVGVELPYVVVTIISAEVVVYEIIVFFVVFE